MGVDIEFWLVNDDQRQQIHFDRDYLFFLALGMIKYEERCDVARVVAERDGEWYRTTLESITLTLQYSLDDELQKYGRMFEKLWLHQYPDATVEWRFSY